MKEAQSFKKTALEVSSHFPTALWTAGSGGNSIDTSLQRKSEELKYSPCYRISSEEGCISFMLEMGTTRARNLLEMSVQVDHQGMKQGSVD
jgi:hypothetical protein